MDIKTLNLTIALLCFIMGLAYAFEGEWGKVGIYSMIFTSNMFFYEFFKERGA